MFLKSLRLAAALSFGIHTSAMAQMEKAAGTCLPLVFQNVSCYKGKPVANFDSCQMRAIRNVRVIEKSDKMLVVDKQISFRSIQFRRNLDDVQEMISEIAGQATLISSPTTEFDKFVNIVAGDMMPILKVAASDLESKSKSNLCNPSKLHWGPEKPNVSEAPAPPKPPTLAWD